jgi:hypothetical protein
MLKFSLYYNNGIEDSLRRKTDVNKYNHREHRVLREFLPVFPRTEKDNIKIDDLLDVK